jgi:transcriptional regulator with XRE-family HTH domain
MHRDIKATQFSKKLKHLMKVRNVTQTDIVEECGIPYSSMSSWINAHRLPRIHTRKALAEFFGVPVEYFESEVDERNVQYEDPVMTFLYNQKQHLITVSMESQNRIFRDFRRTGEVHKMVNYVDHSYSIAMIDLLIAQRMGDLKGD